MAPPQFFAAGWKDVGWVKLLSTCHIPRPSEVYRRFSGAFGRVRREAPEVAVDYNNNMGAVDANDAMRETFTTRIKSKKWWHSMLWWILDTSMINAYVCYAADCRKVKKDPMPRLEFQTVVAAALMGDDAPRDLFTTFKRGRPSSASSTLGEFSPPPPHLEHEAKRLRVDEEKSKPNCVRPVVTSTKGVRRNCRHCYMTQKKQKHVVTKCMGCHVHLCMNCFEPYHMPFAPSSFFASV